MSLIQNSENIILEKSKSNDLKKIVDQIEISKIN
jgi:hypothetical protein